MERRIHVTAVVLRDPAGSVLLVRKRGTTMWMNPGGKPEAGETPEACGAREVREETGLSIRLCGIVNVVSNLLDDLHHTLVVILLADVVGGRAGAADDLDQLRWIDPVEHRTVRYAFAADKRVIDWYFAGGMPLLPIDSRHEAR